jgi:RNA polymerase sigma factor (sigma-70 family)
MLNPNLNFQAEAIDLEKHPEAEHLRMVLFLARRFFRQWHYRLPGLELEDLVQTGYVTLIRCHQQYDPSQGPYGRYLSAALSRAMRREITSALYVLYIPVNAHRRAICLEKDLPLPPTCRRGAAEKVQKARNMVQCQLDACHKQLQSPPLDDKWIDRDALHHDLEQLEEREQWVMNLHYGLDGEKPLTFLEIGARWPKQPVGRQMVEIVHRNALKKLRKRWSECA